VSGEITVFAASSLTDAFREAGGRFEQLNPRTKVVFSFASSATLATQVNEGAPADVFASANQEQMAVVAAKGNVGQSSVFATNSLVVVVPKGSAKVQSFRDLSRPGLKLVLAAPDVPAGQYAREALKNASSDAGYGSDFARRVLANLKSEEPNVRVVLAKVQLGEADAGIVYGTDAAAASVDVARVEIPVEFNVVARYPVAVVKRSGRATTANAFVEFVLGPEGQDLLKRFGFGPPGGLRP
jgi:molybdate transport system substrate-binding protein